MGKVAKTPEGFTHIFVHVVFYVNQYGKIKSVLVAGGNIKGTSSDIYYSSVVS